jgi:hypothetical protein
MRSRVLFTILTILALLLLIAAAFLTRALLGLSVPDANPVPIVDRRKPRDAGPAVSEQVIEVGGRDRMPDDATVLPGTGLVETTEGALPRAGAGGTGPVFPTICRTYGSEVTGRRRYAHPVGYAANFRSDGVVFTLFDDSSLSTPTSEDEEAAEAETTGGEKEAAQQ